MSHWYNIYCKTSNIRRTSVDNKIVDHSDVVGASPVGAAPTISSFSTWHLASRDSAKKAAKQYENLLSVGFGATYIRDLTVYQFWWLFMVRVNICVWHSRTGFASSFTSIVSKPDCLIVLQKALQEIAQNNCSVLFVLFQICIFKQIWL